MQVFIYNKIDILKIFYRGELMKNSCDFYTPTKKEIVNCGTCNHYDFLKSRCDIESQLKKQAKTP